jgi:hypothetical protein
MHDLSRGEERVQKKEEEEEKYLSRYENQRGRKKRANTILYHS